MSKPHKPKPPVRFRETEVHRAFRAVPGATSVEIFPAEGRIVVHTAASAKPANSANEYDNWIAKKDANPPQGS